MFLSLGFVTLFLAVLLLMTSNQSGGQLAHGSGYRKMYEEHGYQTPRHELRAPEFKESNEYKMKGKRFSSY
ncbi:MAG: hypothetical protein R2857_13965 [Vampirovibrionales bacterium]